MFADSLQFLIEFTLMFACHIQNALGGSTYILVLFIIDLLKVLVTPIVIAVVIPFRTRYQDTIMKYQSTSGANDITVLFNASRVFAGGAVCHILKGLKGSCTIYIKEVVEGEVYSVYIIRVGLFVIYEIGQKATHNVHEHMTGLF